MSAAPSVALPAALSSAMSRTFFEQTQAPATQAPAPHFTPQPPQLFGSVVVSNSQPFAGLPSQSEKPGLQAPSPQALPEHAGSAFGSAAQTLPQVPQLFASVASATSQPSASALLQSSWPKSQAPMARLATRRRLRLRQPALREKRAQTRPVPHPADPQHALVLPHQPREVRGHVRLAIEITLRSGGEPLERSNRFEE